MDPCIICDFKYTAIHRKPIECDNCNFTCCLKCFKTYISNKETAFKCMSCKNIFDISFLEIHLTKNYMSKNIKNIQEELLFDIENKYLIGTQRELDLKEKHKEIFSIIDEHKKVLNGINNDLEFAIQESLIFELEQKIKDLSFNYIKKCSQSNCNGMLSEENIKNNNYLCTICDSINCKECEVIITNNKHKCDKNVLKNLKTLKEETKACPTCLSRIYKSEGCNQMYCTKCFTTFDWNTGEIDTGKIHNPHYLDSFKHYNRDPLDIICGRDLHFDSWDVETNLYFKIVHNEIIKKYFCAIFNSKAYINKCVKETSNEMSINRNVRIDYLNKKITEKKYKQICLANVKKTEKQKHILDIVVTYMNCGTEIFYRLFQSWEDSNQTLSAAKIKKFEKEFIALNDMCNEEINKDNKIKKDIFILRFGAEKFK